MKRTVLRMLDEAVLQWGSAAYAYRKTDTGWVPVSFEEARDRAREFATWLLSTGARRNDCIAVLAEGSPEWIVGELGLLMAGCVSVPLSIKLLEEEIPFRLDHSEARAAGRAALPSLGDRLDQCIASVEEEDTVTICYTSGTTGNPKGIMLTHRNYWTNCHDAVKAIPLPPGWRSLIILPVDHSFAHTAGLYTGLVCGVTLYFVDSRGGGIGTLRNIPVNLVESNSHFLFTVPSLTANLMKKIVAGVEEKGGLIERIFKAGIAAGTSYNGNGFTAPRRGVRLKSFLPYKIAKLLIFNKIRKMVFGRSIRFCIGGGALLDVKQQEFFAAFGVPVYQGYGLTEAAPIICANTPLKHKFGTSGMVFDSIECRLAKADGSPAGAHETGEIVIRGGNVMKGYFKNPDASAHALRDGWLYTGDLAYWDTDGFLVVVGREKALLITEDGEKYSPEEIEEAIGFSTDVIDQVMAYCDHRKYTMALVCLDTGKVARLIRARGIRSAEGLLPILRDELYRFKADPKAKKVQAAWVPSVFQFVAEPFSEKNGTVNSTMKLVRHRITEVHSDLIEYAYTKEGSITENPRNLAVLVDLFKLPLTDST